MVPEVELGAAGGEGSRAVRRKAFDVPCVDWPDARKQVSPTTMPVHGEHDEVILWRRLDRPGHESARLSFHPPHRYVAGTAVFSDKQGPCRLDYLVVCDAEWRTLSGRVIGWVGEKLIEVKLAVDPSSRWTLNGADRPDVAGCIDLDLNFSPSTNLLPIRRLGLAIGKEARVRAAWLRFPSFTVEPLEQLYRRVGESTYRYESAGGRFVADLEVNRAGLIVHYPGVWQAL
jgi:uncharacterized protein